MRRDHDRFCASAWRPNRWKAPNPKGEHVAGKQRSNTLSNVLSEGPWSADAVDLKETKSGPDGISLAALRPPAFGQRTLDRH